MRTQRDSRKRNAVTTKSGESVTHSGPGLIGPTLPSTADRKSEACVGMQRGAKLRPAVHHQSKNGRVFEGRALIGGAAAVAVPSLDTVQSNRDTPKDPYRLSRCGRLSLRGVFTASPGKPQKVIKVTCKCWDCPQCAPRKANRYRKAIGELAHSHRLNIMLTLTLDPEKLRGEDSARYINKIFAHFRTYLKRKLGRSPKYIRVLELQKNGNAHLHVLLNDYIRQEWIVEAWSALGGGRIVDIRRVTMRKVSNYLSKYVTKQMLLSAPKRTRRVTTSRGLKLNPKLQSEYTWNLVSIPISRLHEFYWKQAINVSLDAEGNVNAFDLEFPTSAKERS
jgi:hypothetical protein